MPWLWVILLVAAIYLVIKIIQGIWDFIAWLREPRIDPRKHKRLKQSDCNRLQTH